MFLFRFSLLLFAPLGSFLFAGDALRFEEDLRFGADRDEDFYIWTGSHTRVVADERGHMFVADVGADRVLEFDGKGRFVRIVMDKGLGPGEVTGLMAFELTNDGAIAVGRRGGVTVVTQRLDKALAYKDSFTKNLILEAVVVSPAGDAMAGFHVGLDQAAGVRLFQTSRFDNTFEQKQAFDRKTGPLPDRSRLMEPGYWVDTIAANLKRAYTGYTVFNFDDKGRFYSCNSNEYKVTRWQGDKTSQVFSRQVKPLPMSQGHLDAYIESVTEQLGAIPDIGRIITPAVISRAVAKSEPPPVKRAVFALLPTDDFHLLVVRDVDLVTRTNLADVFDEKGTYMGEARLPDNGMVTLIDGGYQPKLHFRNGFAYTVAIDEEGDMDVVRYRVIR